MIHMRLNLILPKVEPKQFEIPKKCPQKGCGGIRFIPRQEVSKKIVDAAYPEVRAWRYECISCGHVFRVYPKGVNHKQISKRVNGMAVMMYLLGLSYGAVEIVLNSVGMGIGKTSVYRAVQEVAGQVPGMKEGKRLDGYRTKAVGADVTSDVVMGWVTWHFGRCNQWDLLSIDEYPAKMQTIEGMA